jgi:type I restriction enzyme, S subunit
MKEGIESICSINPENLVASTPLDYRFRYIDISSVENGRIYWNRVNHFTLGEAPSRARRQIRKNDVLLCTVRPGLQAHTRIEKEENVPLVASTGFAVIRSSSEKDSSFIFHQLFSNDIIAQLRAKEVGSSYPAVNESDIRRLSIFMPDQSQRYAIGKVLDTIDDAIANSEAVIAKLKQVRAGMLHDLLRYGLDEHGQLRDPIAHPEQFNDSPFGLMPSEWKLKTIEQLNIHIIDGDRGSNYPSEVHFLNQGYCVFLNNKNIKNGEFDFSSVQFISKERDSLLRKGKLIVGDIVITTRGTIGNIARFESEEPYTHIRINSGMVIFRNLENNFDPQFFMQIWQYLFHSEYRRLSSGSAQPQFPIRDMLDFRLVVPSKSEQIRIVDKLVKCRSTIKGHENELSKLKLLKSGLQDDLLTGRVRVPESIMEGAKKA